MQSPPLQRIQQTCPHCHCPGCTRSSDSPGPSAAPRAASSCSPTISFPIRRARRTVVPIPNPLRYTSVPGPLIDRALCGCTCRGVYAIVSDCSSLCRRWSKYGGPIGGSRHTRCNGPSLGIAGRRNMSCEHRCQGCRPASVNRCQNVRVAESARLKSVSAVAEMCRPPVVAPKTIVVIPPRPVHWTTRPRHSHR